MYQPDTANPSSLRAQIPCRFPVYQGIRPGAEFDRDCAHRQPVRITFEVIFLRHQSAGFRRVSGGFGMGSWPRLQRKSGLFGILGRIFSRGFSAVRFDVGFSRISRATGQAASTGAGRQESFMFRGLFIVAASRRLQLQIVKQGLHFGRFHLFVYERGGRFRSVRVRT